MYLNVATDDLYQKIASPQVAITDPLRNGGQKKKFNSSRHVAVAMKKFLINANGPCNHHAKFEVFFFCFFFNLYCGWHVSAYNQINLWENTCF